ncbi:MAG TPA: META domain-containing protein [Ignavibacteria bacterium]|nr:META domain-containing protein [Ignavibacteria bacterium]
MKTNLKYLFGVVAIVMITAVVLYSCSGAGTTGTGQSIKNTKWMLESLYGERVDTMYLTSGNEISLNFADSSQMNGKAPCNHYFSTYTVTGTTLTIGAIGATRMACPELDLEQRYFSFLGNVTRYSISSNASGNRLTFYSVTDGLTTTATFRKMY